MNPNDYVTVHVSILSRWRKAFEVTDGEQICVLPKSQIVNVKMISETGECHLVIPRWLAKEKNLEVMK